MTDEGLLLLGACATEVIAQRIGTTLLDASKIGLAEDVEDAIAAGDDDFALMALRRYAPQYSEVATKEIEAALRLLRAVAGTE